VHLIMHRSVDRGMERREVGEVAHVSIDEKALKRGHVYATVVCDSDRGIVLDVAEGRTKQGTIELLESVFEAIKDKVETVSTDMWKAFIGAVEKVFPEAALIHDRFHLIQYLNKAINKVRRREVKEQAKKDLNLWIASVEETGMKEVIRVATMFREHFMVVCNALCHTQSNAKAERMNGKIQEIKTIGRGYRRFENFRVAILFFCGGLSLYPQRIR